MFKYPMYYLPNQKNIVLPFKLGPRISLGAFRLPRPSRPLNFGAGLITLVRKPEIAAQELLMAFRLVHFRPIPTHGDLANKKITQTQDLFEFKLIVVL